MRREHIGLSLSCKFSLTLFLSNGRKVGSREGIHGYHHQTFTNSSLRKGHLHVKRRKIPACSQTHGHGNSPTHTRVYPHTRAFTHPPTRVLSHTHTHACFHTHTHACFHTHTHTRACFHTHTHTHTHTCAYTHACTETLPTAYNLPCDQRVGDRMCVFHFRAATLCRRYTKLQERYSAHTSVGGR
jgi:hypothetical protein